MIKNKRDPEKFRNVSKNGKISEFKPTVLFDNIQYFCFSVNDLNISGTLESDMVLIECLVQIVV